MRSTYSNASDARPTAATVVGAGGIRAMTNSPDTRTPLERRAALADPVEPHSTEHHPSAFQPFGARTRDAGTRHARGRSRRSASLRASRRFVS